MEQTEIPAGRLHLRPWQPYDAPALLEACQDPSISRWTTIPWPYTEQDAQAWAGPVTAGLWAAATAAPFAVLDSTTGELLGSVGLHRIADGQAEVGYWTAAEARGQGVTTQAVEAVCRWGFEALDLERINWYAEVGNWASRAVAEKAGFTVEGLRRRELTHSGGRVDGWVGSLLRDEPVVDRRAFGGPWTDLAGDGLVLRRWRENDGDEEAVLLGLSDPESARWLPVPSPYAAQDARAFLTLTHERWASGHSAPLAVQEDGQVVGLVVLLPSALDAGLAELGWWTSPAARGRRVAPRAVQLLVRWATGLGVERFEAGVDVDNLASQRVAERVGMTCEGVRRAGLRSSPRDGRRHDGLFYALVP